MKVQTTRFGELELDEDSVISMVKGFIGLEECVRFTLLEHRPDSPFLWMQSLDRPELAFLVTDPFSFFSDYEVEVGQEDQTVLSSGGPEDLLVLVTVTVRGAGEEVTANLLGPLVFNLGQRIGKQIILPGDRYKTRHPLTPLRREAA
ncbi:MAG TPA: flagellar assembly protein FliW [Armatimonadota bacterium]|jgi:flagellar assembly factor FliW